MQASVDKVTHKDVIPRRDVSSQPEELQQVVELPVDVAADDDRRRDRLHVGLLDEERLMRVKVGFIFERGNE